MSRSYTLSPQAPPQSAADSFTFAVYERLASFLTLVTLYGWFYQNYMYLRLQKCNLTLNVP
jgi:hypothetical protein